MQFWRAIGGLAGPVTDPDSNEAPDGFKSAEVLRGIQSARDAAYGVFALSVVDVQREGALRPEVPVHLHARLIASLSHGLAMEALDEGLSEGEAAQLVAFAVDGLRRHA